MDKDGCNQAQIAECLGRDLGTVSREIRGRSGYPADKSLLRPSVRFLETGVGGRREHQWIDPSVSAQGEELQKTWTWQSVKRSSENLTCASSRDWALLHRWNTATN